MSLVPTESEEQRKVFMWAAYSAGAHPELRMLYHVPNEGKRSGFTGGLLRAEGLRKGVPDICLPVARGRYHALYIELKRIKGSRLSNEQKEWLQMLNDAGNKAVVCYGFDEAMQEIVSYLEGA